MLFRSVLTQASLAPLLDKFVCVRVINTNALDLAKFQWDYDLSFSTLFFNGDGTLYGRYGSWTHQADPEARETIGYRRALEGALELHRGYGNHAAAKKAGVQKDDVIVAIDGFSARATESGLIGRLLQTRKAGEVVAMTVLRGSERVDIKLPMQ